MINLNDMLTFLAVVDARSFSAAADQLGRTRSAISQAVSRLEADVGARLLYRSTRSLTLTEAGSRLVERCRDIKRSYEDALNDIQDSAGKLSGNITVTAPHALCGSVLVPAVARFAESHPNMNVRLIADDARIDLIGAQIDLAIRVGQPSGQTARVAKVGTLGESLYASRSYVESQGGVPSTARELIGWSHIANDWQGTPTSYDLASGDRLEVQPQFRCNAFPQIMALVTESLGVARLPDMAAHKLVAHGDLVCLAQLGKVPIYSVHHFDKRPPAKIKSFLSALRKQFQRT